MTISTHASGTITTTVTTEHFLSSPNVVGEFRLMLDLNALAANDVLEVRAYKMALAGGTSRALWFYAFYGAQPAHALIALSEWVANVLTDTNAVRFSIKQTFGTTRDIPWSVQKRDDALKPTVADRTLDITATGAAGIDWANVENPATALNLSATNIDVDQVVASVSGAVASVTGSVASVTNDVGVTQAGADKVWLSATRTLTSFGTLVADVATAVWAAATRLLTAGTNIVLAKGTGVTGFTDLSAVQVNTEVDTALTDINLDHLLAVAAVAGDVVNSSVIARLTSKSATPAFTSFVNTTDSLEAIADNAGGSAPTTAQIADAVWDETLAGHVGAGSTGAALNSAGGAADPLLNTVPGSYASGTAGFALGRLDDIEAKTSLISADTVNFTSPVAPATGDLTLYDDTDYSVLSGSVLPTWTNADWSVHDLSAAVSITLYYRARGTYTDTTLGTVTAVDDTTLRLTVTDEQFAAVPYGNKQAGFKIVAVLDVAHGSAEVMLINAALSHHNYTVVQ